VPAAGHPQRKKWNFLTLCESRFFRRRSRRVSLLSNGHFREMDLDQVFSKQSTVSANESWAVLQDTFEAQANDLATVLSYALPTEERPVFIAEYINKARKAVAGLQQDGSEPDVETKSRLEGQASAQKLAVLQEMIGFLKEHGLTTTTPQG
jgi:hypothetical protein